MPIDAHQNRQTQGRFDHRYGGSAAPSHRVACQQRFGVPGHPLNVRSVNNQLAVCLLLSTALPGTHAGSGGAGRLPPVLQTRPEPARGHGFPGAMATPTHIEMPPAPAADGAQADTPMLPSPLPDMLNVAADLGAATCLRSPRHCGTALKTALGVTVFWGVLSTLGHLMNHRRTSHDARTDPMEPQPQVTPPTPRRVTPYHVDPSRLLPAMLFNASELDPAAPPCDSLGAHVNRRWETHHLLQRSRTQLGTLDHLRSNALLVCQQLAEQMAVQQRPDPAAKVVGDLWSTGMDEAGIEVAAAAPLHPLLERISRLTDRAALKDHLFNATAHGSNPLFDFSVLPDLLDPRVNTAYLAQSGLGLPDSTWYHDPARQDLVDAYQAHVARMLVLSGDSVANATRLASHVVALERDLAAVSEPFAVLATDSTPFHNPVTLDEAQQITPHIDWARFFSAQGLDVPATFSLGMPDFFRRIDVLLDTVPMETWQAYVRFHATDDAAPCLSSTFVDTHDAFHGGVLRGRKARVPRFARIMGIIQKEAGDALGPAYTEVAFPAQTQQRVTDVIDSLTAALTHRLQQTPWLDDTSRVQALEKAERLRIDAGHPDRWPTWDDAGTDRTSFLGNIQRIRAHARRRNTAQLGQPVDPTHWKLTPQTVDAYQDNALNRIVIPAAMLQPPLFDPAADDALNFGGIGVVIGHEMAHGFDAIGTMFDGHGREHDWLTPESRARFNALISLAHQQFEQLQAAGVPVDAEVTRDENLADLGGMAIALEALQRATAGTPDPMIDGMTREQRFFANAVLTWRMVTTPERAELERATNNHAPASVRADWPPSNLPAFARAFNCTANDAMVRPADQQVRFL